MAMNEETPRWRRICRGLSSQWHAYAPNVTSDYGLYNDYLLQADEVCLVWDGCNASPREYADFILNGPMCSVTLPLEAEERFKDHESMRRMMPLMGGDFRTLARRELARAPSLEYSGFDSVGLAVYERLLREVPGVHILRSVL